MNQILRQRLALQDIVTTRDAAECGHDRHSLRHLAETGELHRVHRGAYVAKSTWENASPTQRHLLRCRAVLPRYPDAALSHVSAVAAHDLPLQSSPLDVVHLVRTGPGRTGRTADVHVHPVLGSEAVAQIDPGIRVCTAAAAVLQLADWSGLAAGMGPAEAALHAGRITRMDLQLARGLVRLGRGRANADLVVELADRHSESPYETMTRLLLRAIGVEVQQQVRITLPSGSIARVDFLVPALDVVIEYDGRSKYGGASGQKELEREKAREDGLRRLGYGVVRLVERDLDQPAEVLRSIQEAARTATRRR